MAGSEGLSSRRARGTGTIRATPPRARAGGARSRAFLASLLRAQLLILLLLLMAVVVVVVMVVVLVVVPAGVAAREQSPLPVPPARSPGPASGVIRGDRIVEAARASARVPLDAGLRDAGAGARWELAFPVSDVAVSPGASSLKAVLVTAGTVPSRSVFCTVEVRVAGVLVRKVGVKWRLVTGSAPVTGASPSATRRGEGPIASSPAGGRTPSSGASTGVLVRRGSPVVVRATVKGIEVETRGEALGNGALGESIQVRNPVTRAVITGRVTAAGEVQAERR